MLQNSLLTQIFSIITIYKFSVNFRFSTLCSASFLIISPHLSVIIKHKIIFIHFFLSISFIHIDNICAKSIVVIPHIHSIYSKVVCIQPDSFLLCFSIQKKKYPYFEKVSPEKTAVYSGENWSSFGMKLQFYAEKIFLNSGALGLSLSNYSPIFHSDFQGMMKRSPSKWIGSHIYRPSIAFFGVHRSPIYIYVSSFPSTGKI